MASTNDEQSRTESVTGRSRSEIVSERVCFGILIVWVVNAVALVTFAVLGSIASLACAGIGIPLTRTAFNALFTLGVKVNRMSGAFAKDIRQVILAWKGNRPRAPEPEQGVFDFRTGQKRQG